MSVNNQNYKSRTKWEAKFSDLSELSEYGIRCRVVSRLKLKNTPHFCFADLHRIKSNLTLYKLHISIHFLEMVLLTFDNTLL